MPIGTTNIHLDDDGANGGIYSELNNGGSGSDVKFSNMVIQDWADGPVPGSNTNSYWAYGLKTGASDPLYNPMNSAGGSQISSNYKFSYFKNSYSYMDQSTYVIDLYLDNVLPPAGRGDPPNDCDVDLGLYDNSLTSNSICPIAGQAAQNGGTFGPTDVSQSFTFNVEYFYVDGGFACLGFAAYNIEVYVNSTQQYNVGGLNGSNALDYTMFNSTPTNSGSGFDVEIYFT